jgi:peptidyl-prolyl cis-trans isomerase A (cyclophilin A)
MRKYPILLIFLSLFVFAGCRGKPELVLLKPGETEVWRKVDTRELAEVSDSRPRVRLETSMGPIIIELFEDAAPLTVANFLQYVEDTFYDGTIFHRVEPGLVIQGGGFTEAMQRKTTRDPIANEAGNGLRNARGTIGAARTMEMDSATSQFYINLQDNSGFNGDGVTGGYAVFGRVYEGMEIVDTIAFVETDVRSGMQNVPVEPVVILSAERLR